MPETQLRLVHKKGERRGSFAVAMMLGDDVKLARDVNPHHPDELQAFIEAAKQAYPGLNGEGSKIEASLLQLAVQRKKKHAGSEGMANATAVDDAPMSMARGYLDQFRRPDKGESIAHYRDDFYRFAGDSWRKTVKEQFRSQLYDWLDRQNVMRGKGDAEHVEAFRPTTRKVNEIIDALAAIAQVSVDGMPAWLDADRPRPQDVIAFTNGLIDVGRYIKLNETSPIPSTPKWFSENVLPYPFDINAKCPQWLAFLDDIFNGDAELIALLQQFCGYCLTDDTSQQKALLLIGPPRSGKGTTIRQLVRTIGDANCASLRLTQLGERFGLESLIGKTVAVCPDAHLGRSADSVAVLERLKSIIGEDPQCIDVKFREPRPNVRVRTRFVLAVNNLPDLPDSSVAMRSRLLVLPLGNSYEGVEDRTLDDRLSTETPGVMVWALEGLKRLRQQGKFTEPAASVEMLREFSRLSSPVLAFVEDRCKLDPELFVACDSMWEHWQRWCKATGGNPGNKESFGLNIRSAVPTIKRTRPRDDNNERFYAYSGIGLLPTPHGGDDANY